jgi:hypothetical protein
VKSKTKLVPLAVFVTLSALVIALTRYWGVSSKDILMAAVAMSLYGVLVAAFLLRFVLIFLGVFAAYKIIQERHNKRLAA